MRKLHFILLSLLIILPLDAQIRGNNYRVEVSPDNKDWTYYVGQRVTFTVMVLKAGVPMDDVKVDYEMGPVMYPNVKKHDVTLNDGTMKVSSSMKHAGFLRLKVTAHINGKEYKGLCTAAFSPEKIHPTTVCPDDFYQFWSNTLTCARYTSLEPTKELLPERCTKDVNVYQVSFQNIRWGSRTYGILCVPVKSGKYPALLRVPGAGVRPYQGDVLTAGKGAITLEIGIHGIPVTMPQDYYDKLDNGALNCYWNFNRNDRDENYYKRVFVGAVRAIDYICSLPEWNGNCLGVTGSSQGGMLSLVCAALDKRVTFYAAIHAAMCDHTAALKGVACGWPHYFYGQKNADIKEIEASRYYDGVNFARFITVPGWFSFGYNDEVVPPTSAYGTYNIINAQKEIHPYPETGHYWYQEQYDEWNAWLWQQMGIK